MAETAHISIGSFQGNLNAGEVRGENARLVSHATDQSTNIVNSAEMFEQLRAAVRDGVTVATDQQAILETLKKLESAADRPSRVAAYRQLLSDTANYLTIFMPFMPALASYIG